MEWVVLKHAMKEGTGWQVPPQHQGAVGTRAGGELLLSLGPQRIPASRVPR